MPLKPEVRCVPLISSPHPYLGLLLLASALFPLDSYAQGVALEFTQGPLIASNRLIGMGGAYTSIAEGADSYLLNPASFAVRYRYSRDDYFDWDFSLYWLSAILEEDSAPEVGISPDQVKVSSYVGGGLGLQFGVLGGGFHVYSKEYVFTNPNNSEELSLTQSFGIIGMGVALPWQGLTVGIGATPAIITLSSEELGDALELEGTGFSAGVAWAPVLVPFRAGLVYRSSVIASQTSLSPPDEFEYGTVSAMNVPARMTLGFSWMDWERVYNPPASRGNGEVESFLDGRRYLLLSADLGVEFSTEDSISPVSFIGGEPERSGKRATFTPRLGAESEFWANRMVTRVGTYWEPSRVDSSEGRMHFTMGGDIRTTLGWDWKISVAADLAESYANWGIGLGFWH